MMRRAGTPLYRAQIMDFILDSEYTNFQTLQEVFSELKKQGLIRIEQGLMAQDEQAQRSFFYLTKEGEETLDALKSKLRPDIISQAEEYLQKIESLSGQEETLRINYLRTRAGTYEVQLERFKDRKKNCAVIMEARTEEEAVKMCDAWKKQSAELAAYLKDKLLHGDNKE